MQTHKNNYCMPINSGCYAVRKMKQASFQWLRATDRIQFKLAVLVYTELFTARRLVTCPTCCVVSLTHEVVSGPDRCRYVEYLSESLTGCSLQP